MVYDQEKVKKYVRFELDRDTVGNEASLVADLALEQLMVTLRELGGVRLAMRKIISADIITGAKHLMK